MQTYHRLSIADARAMPHLPAASVDLVVTSPPYPMIRMWDDLFVRLDPAIGAALKSGSGLAAYARMHALLDPVWDELFRVLRPGGLACINIGDAVRSFNGDFALYPNHARIVGRLQEAGFTPLPDILWRKPTNAPTKFMGSGMLPAGAYVTLEHEYILVVRKGGKRLFRSAADRARRRESALFWEERNQFFSDVWTDIRGIPQTGAKRQARPRSGAFPFELAYRLVVMFSLIGDTVLDPFWGTGTTALAAAAAGRHSLGCEIDPAYAPQGELMATNGCAQLRDYQLARIERHRKFVSGWEASHGSLKYRNRWYGFPVMTAQEEDLRLALPLAATVPAPRALDVHYETSVPHPAGGATAGQSTANTPTDDGEGAAGSRRAGK